MNPAHAQNGQHYLYALTHNTDLKEAYTPEL